MWWYMHVTSLNSLISSTAALRPMRTGRGVQAAAIRPQRRDRGVLFSLYVHKKWCMYYVCIQRILYIVYHGEVTNHIK